MSFEKIRLVLLICFLSLSVGCAASPAPAAEPGLKEKAAIEATAIVERAEATAIVLRAREAAVSLTKSSSTPTQSPSPTVQNTNPVSSPTKSSSPQSTTTTTSSSSNSDSSLTEQSNSYGLAKSGEVHLLGVGFAYDGGFVQIEYTAPPKVADKWRQGNVRIIDEMTGLVYGNIPVVPIKGPLVGTPREEGQVGYVMLINTDSGIQSGSIVTVVLGDFKQEHVVVK